MRTLANLRAATLAFLDETGNTGTTKTLVDTLLNQANVARAGGMKWSFMRSATKTFTTVPGTTTYNLDATFGRPEMFWDKTAERYLVEVPEREISNMEIPTTGQTYFHYGMTPIDNTVNPATGGIKTLEFLSTPDAADVIEYRFYRKPTWMTDDTDRPDIPEPFEDILVYDALLLMAGYITDISAKSMQVWTKLQMDLETGLLEAYLDGNTRGSRMKQLRDLRGE